VKRRPLLVPILAIVILLGTVQVARLAGYWQTSGQALIAMHDLRADDLRGWISLQQIADGTGVTLSELCSLFGLPADTPAVTALKDIEDVISVPEARTRLGSYLAAGRLPPVEAEALAVPVAPTAVPTVTPAVRGAGGGAGPTPAPAGMLAPADIKGRMTLRDVSEGTGIPLPTLLDAVGLPADTPGTTALRDLPTRVPGIDADRVRQAAARLLAQ
jgi:hypothetical protein